LVEHGERRGELSLAPRRRPNGRLFIWLSLVAVKSFGKGHGTILRGTGRTPAKCDRLADVQPRLPLTCGECGREPRDDENPLDDWRSYSTEVELLTFCAECAEWEFGGG
jgi:hypothetical protein